MAAEKKGIEAKEPTLEERVELLEKALAILEPSEEKGLTFPEEGPTSNPKMEFEDLLSREEPSEGRLSTLEPLPGRQGPSPEKLLNRFPSTAPLPMPWTIRGGWEEGDILFGKPTEAFSGAASSLTLDPCDASGTDNRADDLTVKFQASLTMPYSTTIPTSAIIPYRLADDGDYYVLGTPTLRTWHDLATPGLGIRYDSTAHKIQCKVFVDFGFFQGTVSGWQDITTAVLCTGV